MPAKRGPHTLTKRELKAKYVAQLKAEKIDYIRKNGSAEGWLSSDAYKRIRRNERQAFYRRRKKEERIKAEKASKAIEKAIQQGKPVGQLGLKVLSIIAVDEFFWTALNRRGGAAGSIMSEWEQLEKTYPKSKVIARVKDFDGDTYDYSSKIPLELRIQAMYMQADQEQSAARKAGVKNTSAMHTITATSVELPSGQPLITVEAERM